MTKIAEKHKKAFYEAQDRIRDLLEPYSHRLISQYVTKVDVIETFSVFSKEEDAGEGRHHYRGIVTVWYGMDNKRCPVTISYTENFLREALGMKDEWSWEGTAKLLEKAIPPIKNKEAA